MAHTKKHYTNAYKKKNFNGLDYESEKESKLYKKSLQGGDATVAEKIAAKDRIEAKEKRDKSYAKYTTPKGALAERPGPHKRSHNRITIPELLPFVPKSTQEKIIKFADKFDAKQREKGKKKRALIDLTKKGKKLTAYKGYT